MQTLQECIRYVEKKLQSFGKLNRSTSVTVKGSTFCSLFKKEHAHMPHLVWEALVKGAPGLVFDIIVAPHCRDMELDANALLRFYLNARVQASERNLKQLLRATPQDDELHEYFELPADDFITTPEHSAHFVAGRVVQHSVYMSAVVVPHFDARREKEIRTALEFLLAANGSTDAKRQALACPIIALSSLELLVDAQRTHLIIDRAHMFGTEEHGQWAAWALPLRARGILQRVDLVGAANLASTRPGFCTVHELSPSAPVNEASLRQFVHDLFASRLGAGRTLIIDEEDRFKRAMLLSMQKSNIRTFLVLSRLADSFERADNTQFMKSRTPLGAIVKHAALLGSDELATVVAQQVHVFHNTAIVIILRGNVAQRLNLRDWISLFAALPPAKAVLLIARPEGAAGPTVSDYVTSAPMPRRPELTSD